MTSILELKKYDLENLSLEDYFKTIESVLGQDNNVDELSKFLSAEPYSETKPYLIRRQLRPIDKRFKQIELVYKDCNRINAIVWELNISLSRLKAIFGEPIINNEPYSDSTSFAFKSTNRNIDIIETRHPEWLTKLKDKECFEFTKNNKKVELIDPEFAFIQYKLR